MAAFGSHILQVQGLSLLCAIFLCEVMAPLMSREDLGMVVSSYAVCESVRQFDSHHDATPFSMPEHPSKNGQRNLSH
jgi:hypothetical protein